MRVLYVAARYIPSVGGTELHTHEIARRLRKAGIDVTILTTTFDRSKVGKSTEHDLDIHRVRAWFSSKDWYPAPGIKRAIEGGDWDIVHLQGFHTLVAPVALLAARLAGIPCVVTFHSGGHSSRVRKVVRPFWWKVVAHLLSRVERLIAVSDFERRYFASMLNLPMEKIDVIPSGIDLPRSTDDDGPADDSPLIVSIGRLERYKGHHRLLLAFQAIRQRVPSARLIVVGSGPFENELRQLVSKCGLADDVEITSIPVQRRVELANLLARAHVVVFLSEYESQGIGAMEAIGMGRPVVVADAAALRDLAARGLARPVPVDALPIEVANAVIESMRSGRTASLAHPPTWEESADDMIALYRAVQARKGLSRSRTRVR